MTCMCMILTGHPCAGKTTAARKIGERALRHRSGRVERVVLIDEPTACPDRVSAADCHATPDSEKKTRAALKAAFDRAVAAARHPSDCSTLVVLDSTNYIKGFRYELYCICKEAAVAGHCVVWCLNDVATIREWNRERRRNENPSESNDAYSDELLESLIRRYEPPDERNRWDRPLYRIDLRPSDGSSSARRQQEERWQLSEEANLAGEVLQRSVYNMHGLSDAIGGAGPASPMAPSSGRTTPASSSTFKRAAAFKRPNSGRKLPVTAAVASATTKLTAEALSSLEAAEAPQSGPVVCGTTTSAPPPQAAEPQPSTSPPDGPKKSVEEQIDEILDAFLLNVKPLRAGVSTRRHVATDANVLHEVDAVTQRVCSSIAAAQDRGAAAAAAGGRLLVIVPSGIGGGEDDDDGAAVTPTTLFLKCRRKLPPPELRRIRRQYIQWVGANPPEDASEGGIAKSFLAYIETATQ